MREYKVSNIRAIAILLVVFGHSIVMYSSLWGGHVTSGNYLVLNYMKNIIDLIQMPLFFSLSGYLFYYSMKKKRNATEFIVGKIKRLIIPYLSIALLWMVPIKILAEYEGYYNKNIFEIFIYGIILGKNNGHLWFLPALFLIFIGLYFVQRLFEHSYVYSIIILIVLILLHFFSNKLSAFPYLFNAVYWAVFFYLGYIINLYNVSDKKRCMDITLLKVLLMIITAIFTVVSLITLNKYISFFCSILLVVMIWRIIPEKQNGILECLSKNSFGIYLFHSPLIYVTLRFFSQKSPTFTIGLNFIAFGFASLVLTEIVRRIRLGWLIGEHHEKYIGKRN